MANGYKGFSNTDFERAAQTTLAKHIREVEDASMRNFVMLAQVESAGRVSYNNGGRGFDWKVKYRNHSVEGNTGETQRNFVRKNLWKTANLEYRGYQATDAMYKKEMKEQQGEEAIVRVFEGFIERITESMKQALGTHPYIDGNASGNEEFWHGLESMFGTDGTVNITTGVKRSADAGDIFGYPSDTYAGLVTTLGNYGGENQSGNVWPLGIADAEYDFWSPLVLNANSTASVFPASTNTFAGQGDEVMRYGLINAQRNSSKDGQLDTIVLDRSFYTQFLNLIDDKEQINITSENSLRALGFKNVVVFDGVEVTWEAGVPASTGYGYNIGMIDLLSMGDTLFEPEGPEYDIDTQAFKAVVGTLSNFKFKSPRNFLKIANLT